MVEKGCTVSRQDVLNLMKFFKYKRRTLLKAAEPAQVEGREEQFEKIAALQEVFLENDYPVFSIDTKNKELSGNFYRAGTYYGTEPQRVNDHDFPSFSEGKVIPHGIYEVGDNTGYLLFLTGGYFFFSNSSRSAISMSRSASSCLSRLTSSSNRRM